MENKTPLILGLAAVAIIGIAVFAFSNKGPAPAAMEQTTPVTEQTATAPTSAPTAMEAPTESTTEAMTAADYTDGEYTSKGEYTAPSGKEEINVTVTLKDGMIEDVQYEALTSHPISTRWQKTFGDNFKPLVVGKSIDEVELDKVSGSSLTPKGFNDAIEKIKAQAQA